LVVDVIHQASRVCQSLSEVHPDHVSDPSSGSGAQQQALPVYASLRTLHANLLAHIRRASSAIAAVSGVPTPSVPPSGRGAAAPSSSAAVAAATSHDYRRNVYLDAQLIELEVETMRWYKERIEQAQRRIDEWKKKQQLQHDVVDSSTAQSLQHQQ